MIDIENELFTIIRKKVLQEFPKAFVVGEELPAPAQFPCVFLVEADNQVYRNGRDSSETENYAQVMYEVNVYSNSVRAKKAEAKAILNIVDNEFKRLGFTRITKQQLPCLNNGTIMRLLARYRAVVSKDKVIYRR